MIDTRHLEASFPDCRTVKLTDPPIGVVNTANLHSVSDDFERMGNSDAKICEGCPRERGRM